MRVMPGETLAQIVALIDFRDACNALLRDRFDEHVRRHQGEAGDVVSVARRINQRDRRPVRMPGKNRAHNRKVRQQFRQHV